MGNLTFTVLEITVLMLGAILLGITIHFFITSRRSLSTSSLANAKINKSLEDWKLRYFNDIESRDKEISRTKEQLLKAEENSQIYTIEAEEMRKQAEAEKKKSYIQAYIPHIGIALREILGLSKAEEDKIVKTLTDTLEKSRMP